VYIRQTTGRCPQGCGECAGAVVAAGKAKALPCEEWELGLGEPGLAMAYFPDQDYREGFCPCEALNHGALFPELVK